MLILKDFIILHFPCINIFFFYYIFILTIIFYFNTHVNFNIIGHAMFGMLASSVVDNGF